MKHNITIEHKENGKWVKVVEVIEDANRQSFIAAFRYINEFLGLHVVDSRHTRKGEKRVHYYKTAAANGGFDFRVMF